MKNSILISTLTIFSFGVFAQANITMVNNKFEQVQENTGKQFCCPKCDYCAPKEGKCPTHFIILIAEGNFYCDVCNITNDIGGNCTICGKEMKKLECKKPVDKKIVSCTDGSCDQGPKK